MDRIKINPIIKKDLRVTSRSMKMAWELFAYVAILGIIFLLMFSAFRSYSSDFDNTELYQAYVFFFPALAITQLGIIAIAIPVITASSISGERERGTLDTLLTTTAGLNSIVFGKMMSAVIRVMIFIIASIPLMAISFMVGGLSWMVLFEFLGLSLVYAIFAGSIGVYCSARCKKTITSVMMSFGLYFVVYALSFVPMIIAAIMFSRSYGSALENALKTTFTLQLVNPVVNFVVFFLTRLTSEDFLEEIFDNIFLGNSNVWMILSVIVQLLLAWFFLKLAANRINPLNDRNVKKA
ncbi:MAG: ABC transporter permease subunit [Eubacterium sp.]|nr:ABC transporter permease subunit [Eubacterium sp.]MBQ8952444.1 ABC transporter permease subunit [Eubacterium sp.]